ncbi:MAG: copper ion binding protein [Treponema sp.]|jgi:copper chaperone|nr:copper ion binding protein [Treponema sp.]
MEKSIIKVEGMSCNHCVKAIKKAVNALAASPEAGIGSVNADLEKGIVTVEFDKSLVTIEKIKRAIEDEGFGVVL